MANKPITKRYIDLNSLSHCNSPIYQHTRTIINTRENIQNSITPGLSLSSFVLQNPCINMQSEITPTDGSILRTGLRQFTTSV